MTPQATRTFEQGISAALMDVRRNVAEILSAVGANATRPRGLARRLGLDKTLAWKLSRIVGEEDAIAVLDHLPGKSGWEIAIGSLQDAGASAGAITSLRGALADVDQLIDVHCGDRETLEVMLHGMVGGELEREEAGRKQAFLGNRAIYGVQAKVQVCSHFIAPNAKDQSLIDSAIVTGLVGLRRLRRDSVWTVATMRQYSDDGTALAVRDLHPIDPRATEGVPLLIDFCSSPLPTLKATPGLNGTTNYEMTEGPIGKSSAITCLTGRVSRGRFTRYRTETDRYAEYMATVRTPAEALLHDVFLHRDFLSTDEPVVAVYRHLPDEPRYPSGGRDQGIIRTSEPLVALEPGMSGAEYPDLPRYLEMLQYVFDQLGWDPAKFVGFRHRLRYPPMPSSSVIRYELEAPPG